MLLETETTENIFHEDKEENMTIPPPVRRRSSIATVARESSVELYRKVDEKLHAYE